jgi:hypothetical protein
MFRSFALALAVTSVAAWERSYDDQRQPGAYGADNQHYGHQAGYGGYGHGKQSIRSSRNVDSHNSHRQSGHQGQGHNQWVDNAWNQWGTNNHWDTQKSVDNKWGNNSGKINVTLNSVSGHYDQDYGQQRRGIGYEGHQNTSGDVGYTIGLGGHAFGYQPGTHSYGYENNRDYGYGGWANNLGAWNHGANYDNFGQQHHDDHTRGVANDANDSVDQKRNRRAGGTYADLQELEDTDRRDDGDQYKRERVASLTDLRYGTGHDLGVRVGKANRGKGVGVNGKVQRNYQDGSYGGSRQNYGLAGTDYTGYDAPSETLSGSGRGLGLEDQSARGSNKGWSRYGSDVHQGRPGDSKKGLGDGLRHERPHKQPQPSYSRYW